MPPPSTTTSTRLIRSLALIARGQLVKGLDHRRDRHRFDEVSTPFGERERHFNAFDFVDRPAPRTSPQALYPRRQFFMVTEQELRLQRLELQACMTVVIAQYPTNRERPVLPRHVNGRQVEGNDDAARPDRLERVQHPGDHLFVPESAQAGALDFNEGGDFTAFLKELHDIAQRRNQHTGKAAVQTLRFVNFDATELRGRVVEHGTWQASRPGQLVMMDHDRYAIGGQMNIEFEEAHAEFHCGTQRRERVLREIAGIAAMCNKVNEAMCEWAGHSVQRARVCRTNPTATAFSSRQSCATMRCRGHYT